MNTPLTTLTRDARVAVIALPATPRASALSRTAVAVAMSVGLAGMFSGPSRAEQPPPPCNPNPTAAQDRFAVAQRADVINLPFPLLARLVRMADRPHSELPIRAFAEASDPSQLFQYYRLSSAGFERNIFTTLTPGVTDGVGPTAANAANCGLATLGAVRVVLEPKAGLPTDPNDPGAFVDIFTDISNLFVINNESGWYEGWMIHNLRVAPVQPPRAGPLPAPGHAQFGTITPQDAAALVAQGSHHNVPGAFFTTDGNAVRPHNSSDHFPDRQTNLVPLYLSMGAYNCLQQADCHSYWELNQYTNWIHPLYELPFTGGFPHDFGLPADAFEQGKIGARQSIVPGSGPAGVENTPQSHGDNPHNPRDPDRALNADPEESTIDEHKETRLRFIPSGLANEIMLDVYQRPQSFEPMVTDLNQRLFDAYAFEVSLVDGSGDGVVDFVEGDLEGTSDGGQSNDRLYIPATQYEAFAVTREINDGLLAPRFSPSQRAWVLFGRLHQVSPSVPASIPRDGDDR